MSTGVGMSDCCLSGKLHDGTPTGKVEVIDNLQTYVAAPKDNSKAKSIIFLVDSKSIAHMCNSMGEKAKSSPVFGWEFKNVRLLADSKLMAHLLDVGLNKSSFQIMRRRDSTAISRMSTKATQFLSIS
jgi:hypothetical protein